MPRETRRSSAQQQAHALHAADHERRVVTFSSLRPSDSIEPATIVGGAAHHGADGMLGQHLGRALKPARLGCSVCCAFRWRQIDQKFFELSESRQALAIQRHYTIPPWEHTLAPFAAPARPLPGEPYKDGLFRRRERQRERPGEMGLQSDQASTRVFDEHASLRPRSRPAVGDQRAKLAAATDDWAPWHRGQHMFLVK